MDARRHPAHCTPLPPEASTPACSRRGPPPCEGCSASTWSSGPRRPRSARFSPGKSSRGIAIVWGSRPKLSGFQDFPPSRLRIFRTKHSNQEPAALRPICVARLHVVRTPGSGNPRLRHSTKPMGSQISGSFAIGQHKQSQIKRQADETQRTMKRSERKELRGPWLLRPLLPKRQADRTPVTRLKRENGL